MTSAKRREIDRRIAERVQRAEADRDLALEALELIAKREDVSVNGEYTKRDQPALDAVAANQLARATLAAARSSRTDPEGE